MLEIKITATEISEAINNLARAIGLAVTNPVGMTIGVVPTNTTFADADIQAEPQRSTLAQATPIPTPTAVPTVPATAPQNVTTAPNTPSANYPTEITSTASTVPTSTPQFTLEMIAKAGTALIDAGKMSELSALLAKYGVEALTSLDPAQYGAFANDLRGLGAAI